MARETGCKEWRASAAACHSTVFSSTPGRTMMRSNAMVSAVKVPVLSNTMLSICERLSNACKRRTKIPLRANPPAAAKSAAGVANDNAQGQVTISTETAIITALAGSVCHHHTAAPNADNNTISKKGLASLSAYCAKRGLSTEACSIKSTICA